MNIDPFALPAIVATLIVYVATLKWRRVGNGRLTPWLGAFALVVSIPALLFDFYYTHLFNRAAWFYQFRSLPGSEFAAIGLGFGVAIGLTALRLTKAWHVAPVVTGFLLAAFVAVPYVKTLISPLDYSVLHEKDNGPVCMQTTMSTCGPACAVTLLRLFGIHATEAQIAEESYSARSGTENWYLARALRRRGLSVQYRILPPHPQNLPYPSIAGLGLGRSGHFVTVLGRTSSGYVIGNPLTGMYTLNDQQILQHPFSGFFMVVGRAKTS